MKDWEYQFTEFVRSTQDLQTQVRQDFEGHDLESLLSPLGSLDLDIDGIDEEFRAISSSLKLRAVPIPALAEAWQERARFIGELINPIREQFSVPEQLDLIRDPVISVQEVLENPAFQNFSQVAENLATVYMKLSLSGASLRAVWWVQHSLIKIR